MSESCSLQIVGVDVQAIALALTACFVPALQQLKQTQARALEYRAHLHTAGKYGITRHVGSSCRHDCPAQAVLVYLQHRPFKAGIVLD